MEGGRAPQLEAVERWLAAFAFHASAQPSVAVSVSRLSLAALGLLCATILTMGPVRIPGILTLDINALLYCSVASIVGVQIAFFGLFAMAIARKMRLRIAHGFPEKLMHAASEGIAITLGACLVLGGIGGAIYAILQWGHSSFGALIPSDMMRITIPSVTNWQAVEFAVETTPVRPNCDATFYSSILRTEYAFPRGGFMGLLVAIIVRNANTDQAQRIVDSS